MTRKGGVGSRWARGASSVEFALVVPVLIMLIVAIVEFSFQMFIKATISAAARDGARYYAIHGLNAEASDTAAELTVAAVNQVTKTAGITIGSGAPNPASGPWIKLKVCDTSGTPEDCSAETYPGSLGNTWSPVCPNTQGYAIVIVNYTQPTVSGALLSSLIKLLSPTSTWTGFSSFTYTERGRMICAG